MPQNLPSDAKSIFGHAIELADGNERNHYLNQACADRNDLRKEVEALLAAHEQVGEFLNRPVALAAIPTESYEPISEGPGTRIGPYKLLQQIGEGGMGTVFMAEQLEPVHRKVALKIIKPGMDSKQVVARFEAERQALSMMDHPNIAKVLDAGTTASGRPFFVMELVHGVPITEFCDSNKLTPRDRLALFVPICQAIQHAHQKGVIHRDVKPTNILVTMYDDKPVPKVIDFGVAKAIEQRLTEKTLFTNYGALVGTLEYMSPEQAEMNAFGVDTRSDIFSLGVLLYELLTGTTPVERKRLRQAALDEVVRIIKEEEPPRPSVRLSTSGNLAKVAQTRKTEPGKLSAFVKGELDWIVMRCLEKDRTRRYETANALARDVERFLNDEPVEACPPAWGYRLRKTLRKNYVVVGFSAIIFLLILSSAIMSIGLAMIARQAERRAEHQLLQATLNAEEAQQQRRLAEEQRKQVEQEKMAAQAVRDFLQKDLLLQASTYHQALTRRLLGGNFTIEDNPRIHELLDRTAEQLTPEKMEAKFPNMPLVQAEILTTVGEAYQWLNQLGKSKDFLERAVQLYQKQGDTDNLKSFQARQELAMAYFWSGKPTQGIQLMEAVRDDLSRVLGPYHPETFHCKERLGGFYIGTKGAAATVEYFRQLRDDAEKHLGPTDFHTVYAFHEYAYTLVNSGRVKEGIREFETMKKVASDTLPLDDPAIQIYYLNLIDAYRKDNRREDGTKLLEDLLSKCESKYGPLHTSTWRLRHEVGWDYMGSGKKEEAVKLFEKNLGAATKNQVEVAIEALYSGYMNVGRLQDALVQIRKVYDLVLQRHGEKHRSYQLGRIRARIGLALLQQKKYDEAEPWLIQGYEEMVEYIKQKPFYDSGLVEDINRQITQMYKEMNNPEKTKVWVNKSLQQMEKNRQQLQKQPHQNFRPVLKSTSQLALRYVEVGRKEDVLRLFQETLTHHKVNGWPLNDELALNFLYDLQRAINQIGRDDLAVEMSTAIVADLRKQPNATPAILARQLFVLGYFQHRTKQWTEAEAHLLEALQIQTQVDAKHWTTTRTKFWLGTVLCHRQNYTEAEPMLLACYQESVERIANAPAWEKDFPARTATQLIELYKAINKPEEIQKWETVQQKYIKTEPTK